MLTFQAENHKYTSIDPNEQIDWISVTSFVGLFKQKFDAHPQAVKSAKNKRSKWYGMTVEDILEAWSSEGKRATDLGTWYHDQRERDLTDHITIERSGIEVPIIKPLYDGLVKLAPDQKLVDGVYPEHFVFLKSAGICGQSDRVEIVKQHVDIIDYKTNKEIKKESYKNFEGLSQKMLGPLVHLDDCNYNHYALQLSIYMYIILRQNPTFKPGELSLQHVVFEEEGKDKFGYPIAKRNQDGEPIVQEVITYMLPYMKNEVISMINWLHDNRDKITKTKS
jgi:hypothetical protein